MHHAQDKATRATLGMVAESHSFLASQQSEDLDESNWCRRTCIERFAWLVIRDRSSTDNTCSQTYQLQHDLFQERCPSTLCKTFLFLTKNSTF